MWVLTVFEKKSFRMFEFTTKAEAVRAYIKFHNAVLSYTR